MNQRSIMTLALAAALFLPALGDVALAAGNDHGHEGGQKQTQSRLYSTSGIVESIDEAEQKMTITHEPIPALGWPHMTMRFQVEDPLFLTQVKPGQRIEFDFRTSDGASIIVDLDTK